MILVDSNVLMYLVGAEHPHKADVHRRLDDLIAREQRLVTDVEVLQEILDRYASIERVDAIQPAFDAVLDVVDESVSGSSSSTSRPPSASTADSTVSQESVDCPDRVCEPDPEWRPLEALPTRL